MKNKEIVKNVVIVILLIIAIVLGTFLIYANKDKVKIVKENEMTRTEVEELLVKGSNNSNWYLETTAVTEITKMQDKELDKEDNDSVNLIRTEQYFKDNISKIITNKNNKVNGISWTDFNSAKQIYISNENKTVETKELEPEVNNIPRLNANILDSIKDNNNKFEYTGEVNYAGEDCIVIKLTNKEQGTTEISYIDSKTGVQLKNIKNYKNAQTVTYYYIQYDIVSDEDIERPNMLDYATYTQK